MGLKLENGVLEILVFLNFHYPIITEDSFGTYILLLCPVRGWRALDSGRS